jgi:hypothetical protein
VVNYKLLERGEDEPFFGLDEHEKAKVLKIMRDFKLKIEDEHLRVFAERTQPSADLYIYDKQHAVDDRA